MKVGIPQSSIMIKDCEHTIKKYVSAESGHLDIDRLAVDDAHVAVKGFFPGAVCGAIFLLPALYSPLLEGGQVVLPSQKGLILL